MLTVFTAKLPVSQHWDLNLLMTLALAGQLLALKRFERFYLKNRAFIVIAVRLVRVYCACRALQSMRQLPIWSQLSTWFKVAMYAVNLGLHCVTCPLPFNLQLLVHTGCISCTLSF